MAKNKTAQKAEARRKTHRRLSKSQQTEEKGGTFKVLRGFHIVDGKPLGKGEVFESDQDLDVRFKEERKFKRIGDAGAQSEDDDDDEEEDVTAASRAAAKRNPKGEHDRSMGAVKDDGEDDEEDDEAESDDEDEEDDEEEEVGLQSADADEEDEEEESEEEDEGEDVTADFKKEAKAAGATVTKVGKTYNLADKKGKVIGRKTGYKTKADVKAALKKAAK